MAKNSDNWISAIKMKNISILVICLLAVCGLIASRLMAATQAQITFHVVTDEGKPVSNVEVTASTFGHHESGEGFGKDIYNDFKGKTDEKGLVTINFPTERGDCNYGIYHVAGFYCTVGLDYQFKNVVGNKWQPWSPVVDVILKPVINPIPMYARKIGFAQPFSIPALDQPAGFDLMVGDWVAPNGKGSVADLIFTLSQSVPFVNTSKPFHATLKVSFSNKGDGIQSVLVPINKGSNFRLPRYAPQDGYESVLVKELGRPAVGKPISYGDREDQNYFFRVRTVTDEGGKIKSALYGKIEGNISVDVTDSKAGEIVFSYYLNPNSNDRNMEFSRRDNLFKNLSSLEQP